MTTQFQQAAATKPDGIAVMGHPGDTAFDPLIDAAENRWHHRDQHEHTAADWRKPNTPPMVLVTPAPFSTRLDMPWARKPSNAQV